MNERLNDGRRKSIFHYTSLSLSGMITATFRGTAASQRPHSLSQSHSSLNGVRPRPPRHRLSPPLQLNRKTVGRSEESRTERAKRTNEQHWKRRRRAGGSCRWPSAAGRLEGEGHRTDWSGSSAAAIQPATHAGPERKTRHKRARVSCCYFPAPFLPSRSVCSAPQLDRTDERERAPARGREAGSAHVVLLLSACDSGARAPHSVRLSNSRNSSELLKVTLATLGRPIQIANSLSPFFPPNQAMRIIENHGKF